MIYNNKRLKTIALERFESVKAELTTTTTTIKIITIMKRPGLRPCRSAEASGFPARSHRFLEVRAGQLAVLRVVVEHRAQLQVRPGLHSLRGLELEHGLQAVHTQADFGRTGGSEMFGEPEKSQIPGVRGLSACSRHHHHNNNNTRSRGNLARARTAARVPRPYPERDLG